MTLGEAIKLIRTSKGMKQCELAELAELSISYCSLLERDKRDPAFSTVQAIADALGVPAFVLIYMTNEAIIPQELAEKMAHYVYTFMRGGE